MDFENPIKAFIKHRMEEQETKAQMTKPANKAVIFTDADQRKKKAYMQLTEISLFIIKSIIVFFLHKNHHYRYLCRI